MIVDLQLTREPIPAALPCPEALRGRAGAWVEFRGVVRAEEDGRCIAALAYEAYEAMALREMRRLAEELGRQHGGLAVRVVHRLGLIPVGETALYVGVAGAHRAEALALLAAFLDRLKQDVPIWKHRALPSETGSGFGP